MTTTATTEAIVHGMNVLSLNQHHSYHNHNTLKNYPSSEYRQSYYVDEDDDDQTSEVTVTTIKDSNKSLAAHATTPITNQDWLDEIEHSFDHNNETYNIDNLDSSQDFYDHHSIIQSYLEPSCIPQQQQLPPRSLPPLLPQKSKFSLMKSRVKRVFGISGVNNKSLPVFSTSSSISTANERWAPSIDSSICSSTTTAAATFQDNASICSTKKYNRHSCGLSTASFKQNKPNTTAPLVAEAPLPPLPPPPRPVKSILKKQQEQQYTFTKQPPPLVLPRRRHSGGLDGQKRKQQQRWSRISMTPSKRLSVVMMLKRKKSAAANTRGEEESNTVLKFNKYVNVHETWSKGEYDRSSDPDAVCTRLTANLAQQIKQELNHFKLHEMSVHDSSRIHTHFFL